MVGLNPFASRHNSPRTGTPPPSYRENDHSPLIFEETTVTRTEIITTTTETTTHFFSLPLWKRRVNQTSASNKGFADEMGFLASSPRFRLDKDLPPTPPDSGSHSSLLTSSRAPSRGHSAEQETSLPVPFSPSDSGGSAFGNLPRPTSVLAQATLGLSLPHVLPHIPVSSSSSEINSIVFASPSSSDAISSHVQSKQRAISTVGSYTSAEVSSQQRRTRGLSLGPSGLLGFGSGEAKGKEKVMVNEKESEAVHNKVSKLSRRASFWSRKKISSSPEPLPSARRSEISLVPLPALPPFSPFDVDMTRVSSSEGQPSKLPKPHHSCGLSRSHSEKGRHSSMKPPDPPPLPLPLPSPNSLLPRRPMTADGPSARSKLSLTPGPLTSSPLASPVTEKTLDLSRKSENAPLQRPRAQTNPPLLRRLSMNLFSSSPAPASPTPAVISPSPLRVSTTSKPVPVPKPQIDEESPEGYLQRLMGSVSRAEIGGVLASSGHDFHVQALRSYIGRFDFANDPLDVALRRLLMDVGLPRETQQIDRVMEAFASRYYQLHPGLFTSEDQPYVLAFSLIMLHTDAFNKSNKRKMTKPDYIKNTRMPGVAPEVLDCFYDNIVFVPFIFVEDPVDVNGQRGFSVDGSKNLSTSSSGNLKANKVDPYYLISNNLLDPLRVDVEQFVPLLNPYNYEGTAGPWSEEELQRAFSNPDVIELGTDPSRTISTAPFFGGGGAAAGPFASPDIPRDATLRLNATKLGVLNRKDDVLEGGKKASSRKWKPFSVVLTGSQLLFVRDSTWAIAFLSQTEDARDSGYLSAASAFKPDEVMSLKDAVAVFDRSYSKHGNTFRLVLADGRQFLFVTDSQSEMNQWISRINYASAFKSTGVRMRPVGMSGRDLELTGVAAATSHLHDLQHNQSRSEWNNNASRDLMDMLSGKDNSSFKQTQAGRRVTAMSSTSDGDYDVPVAPEVDGADQFKATFDQVKADLAAGRCASPDCDVAISDQNSNPLDSQTRLPSRSRIVVSKIHELESRIAASQVQLDSDIRFVRNVATLTPFQKSTRDRLMVAVQTLAKRIIRVRLELARCMCHRDILYNDLVAEGKTWSRAKKLALRAAIEMLQSHQTPSAVPSMTLSFPETDGVNSTPISIPSKSYTPSAHKSESTAGSLQSFHSAFEFSPEWPSTPDDISPSDRLGTNRSPQSPTTHSNRSSNSNDDQYTPGPPTLSRRLSDVTSPRSSNDEINHEKFYTARESIQEQAEEWNRTRCAQRVSLVRVPSAYRLARKLERESS
ncbi:hypothetical protein D9757_006388 [Collybiopsis confluens]|uniref:Uncharacterized protein n=1 Tax=Collybiopsis confluens TaxID=2823264 RepID=A0A8H5M6Y6_9AGAR|nr:hypothetical protein D9757_006388 [Collybiopsis confluens]